MNWYAIVAKPTKEALADLNLRWLGFETYFPYRGERKRAKASKVFPSLSKIAFFPGYLFIRSVVDMLPEAHFAFGFSRFVTAPGGDPCAIPEEVMQRVFDQLGNDGRAFNPVAGKRKPRHLGGCRGRVDNEGSPFFGFYVQVVEVLDNDRLVVKFENALFGAAGRTMQMPAADVSEPEPRKTQTARQAHGSPY